VAGGVVAGGVVAGGVVAGGVVAAGGVAGSVVVLGAMASFGALLPNHPAYHPMIANMMTTTTIPMTVFFLSMITSLAPISGF
jgi:hypothetical protein